MNVSLTERDLDLLAILSSKVARLTFRQLSRLAEIKSPSSAGSIRWVERLVKSRLLEQRTVNLPPVEEFAGPPYFWSPDKPTVSPPEFTEEPCNVRVTNARPTQVYFASRLTLNLYGFDQRQQVSNSQLTYDMHVAEIFLHYLSERPNEAERWVHSPNSIPTAAYLQDSDYRVSRLINLVDQFNFRKLEQFHDYCCERELPYELWRFRTSAGPTESAG